MESTVAPDVNPWYALRVRSKFERIASSHLRQRGFEEFSPCVKVETRWSDRNKITEKSLFPGYVFCRLDVQNRLPVLTVPGVVGLLSFGDGPAPIPDREVESVRTLVQSGMLVTPWPFLQVGRKVLIEHGSLAGVEGIVEQVKGKFRLVVSIPILQRAVSTEVDRAWVRPLPPSLNDATPKGSEATLIRAC